MHRYKIELFLHVSGAIAVFVAYGILLFGMAALRRATRVEQVRALAGPLVAGRRMGLEHIPFIAVPVITGVILLVATGLDMALTAWGLRRTWMVVATVSLVLITPLPLLVIGPRLYAVAGAAEREPDGPLSEALVARIHDPILWAALAAVTAVLLGIVFLMTNKPSLGISVVAMLAALGIGLVSSLPLWRATTKRRHAQ
jgi:hypothetical protein